MDFRAYLDQYAEATDEILDAVTPLFDRATTAESDQILRALGKLQAVQNAYNAEWEREVESALEELADAGDIEVMTADDGEVWVRLTEQGRTNPQHSAVKP